MLKNKIRAKIVLGLPLTKRERAYYLLFISTIEEAKEYLEKEEEQKCNK